VRGKVSPEIEDSGILNQNYLYKPAILTLSVVQVGQGRPRYTLVNLECIKLLVTTMN
jgi:hypothetical protein